MPDPVSLVFPKEISTVFTRLPERNFLTPTYLSSLVMLPVLPKQFERFITTEFYPLEQENLKEILFRRAMKLWSRLDLDQNENQLKIHFNRQFHDISTTHSFHVTSEDGIERLELRAKQKSSRYVIYYPPNAQDAMYIESILQQVSDPKFANSNHIFWNYPGVESKKTYSMSVYDLIYSGLKQVLDLLEQEIPIQNITLNARSLGGGIASQVMKYLGRTDYLPNLHVDRSFSSISAIAVSIADKIIETIPKKWQPLAIIILSFALLGISTGLILSGIIATVGVVCSAALALLSYVLAHCIQILRMAVALLPYTERAQAFLNQFTLFLHRNVSHFSVWMQNKLFNGLATVVGGITAVAGLIIGGLLGAFIGSIFSIPILSAYNTEHRLLLNKILKLLVSIAHVELDSATALHNAVMRVENSPSMTSVNTADDAVIPPSAALNTGLKFGPQASENEADFPLLNKMSFFWYESGGHNDTPENLYRSLRCAL